MANASIKARLAALSDKNEARELRNLFEAIQADNAALRASFAALTAKLDADAGVTDTNYAATTNPPAATLVD